MAGKLKNKLYHTTIKRIGAKQELLPIKYHKESCTLYISYVSAYRVRSMYLYVSLDFT